mgnify:CR=1 FL=1
MRTLPSLTNVSLINTRLRLDILASDASTTFVHCMNTPDGIVACSPIKWDVPFGGGLGVPSDYQITLTFPGSSAGATILTRLPLYRRATARLTVLANSDSFQPHVGRVRGIERDLTDPQRLTLRIFDRFTDDNQMVPRATIIDSYTTIHPEDQSKGYSEYYGDESLRPFYFTATDCDLSILLGPRNVSSASHVTSLWVNAEVAIRGQSNVIGEVSATLGGFWLPGGGKFVPAGPVMPSVALGDVVTTLKHNLLLNKSWSQQSGSTNAASGGYPFECGDVGSNDVRLWSWSDVIHLATPNSFGFINGYNEGFISGRPDGITAAENFGPTIDNATAIKIFNTTRLGLAIRQTDTLRTTAVIAITSGTSELAQTIYASSLTNVFSGTTDIASGNARFLLTSRSSRRISITASAPSIGTQTMSVSVFMLAQLESSAYKSYSIWGNTTADSGTRIAISDNPIAILDHINSVDLGLPWLQNQSSAAQVLVQSHEYHAFISARRSARELIHEFGFLSGVNMWIGDSGAMHFRTYQESGAATVDATVPWTNMVRDTMRISENSIADGMAAMASEITLKYGYQFHLGAFDKTLRAFRGNNALCDSLDASGVSQVQAIGTEYIIADDTASYALGNIVRMAAQPKEIFVADLPGTAFTMEPADVIEIQHPSIQGSIGLYQVVALQHDYMTGRVSFTAAKLLTLTP